MQLRGKTLFGTTVVVPALLVVGLLGARGQADEPSRLSRLFRFGSDSSSSSSNPSPNNRPPRDLGAPAPSATSPSVSSFPAPGTMSSAASRIAPRPRVTRAVTEADPIVTRIALGRSNDGSQFGMFLQVYADGTIIDGEGEHHVSREVLRPVLDALQAGELYRVKGHCGSPSADFIEDVQVIVYERSLGRLRANAFSYAGSPQGCEHAVAHLHNALDALQAKISRPPGGASSTAPGPAISAPLPANDHPTTIPLTPAQ